MSLLYKAQNKPVMCSIQCYTTLVNMKSVAVAFVVMAVSQTLALPTNGNGAEIVFSEDRNVYPANGADGHKIDFLQQNDAETLEEALYTYTELLKGLKQQKSGIRHPPQVINDQPDRTNDVANDQTTALCTEPACDCTQLKKGFFEGTAPNGDTCTVFNVPYCEGVCYARHK